MRAKQRKRRKLDKRMAQLVSRVEANELVIKEYKKLADGERSQRIAAERKLREIVGIEQKEGGLLWEVRVCISEQQARYIHDHLKESFAKHITEDIMRKVLKCPAIAQGRYDYPQRLGAG